MNGSRQLERKFRVSFWHKLTVARCCAMMLPANADTYSNTACYAALEGRVAFLPPAEPSNDLQRLQYGDITAYHFPDFPETPGAQFSRDGAMPTVIPIRLPMSAWWMR